MLKGRYCSAFDISMAEYRVYSLIFNAMMKDYDKKKKVTQDLKVCELKYLQYVQEHYKALKQLGKDSIRFYLDVRGSIE